MKIRLAHHHSPLLLLSRSSQAASLEEALSKKAPKRATQVPHPVLFIPEAHIATSTPT